MEIDSCKPPDELLRENEELRARLEEAEETLQAIRLGDIDAVVATGPKGDQVFTLQGADHVYRMMVEQMNESAATVNLDGVVLFANANLLVLLELPAEQILGRPVQEFVSLADQALFSRLLGQAVHGTAKGEILLETTTGKHIPVLLSLSVLQPDDTPIISMLITDLSEQKLNEGLRQAKIEAVTANRAKSGFLANMSHEIRTPLSGIIGLTQMSLSQSPRQDLREHLEMILDSSRSLLGIVNDILDFSKIEAGKMEFLPVDFDLRDTLDRTMKPFKFSARQKGLTLTVRLDSQVPAMVHGDPDRIMQVVRNLVGNALKFTEQGEVEVAVSLTRPGDPMLVAYSVRDTGIGIPENRQHELFQIFSQLESTSTKRFGGTGLGLAISRLLVEMMGGCIDVESVPGKGSTFSFTVSLRPAIESSWEAQRPDSAPEAGSFAGLRVLLAEDNGVNRLFLEHFLTEAGCQVSLAGSGTQVLEQLCQEPADFVLMDIQMPEMDGVEATRRIRDGEAGEAARGMPVVALTAYSMKGDCERFLAAGLDGYVSKPVEIDELFVVMRRVLQGSSRDSDEPGSSHETTPSRPTSEVNSSLLKGV